MFRIFSKDFFSIILYFYGNRIHVSKNIPGYLLNKNIYFCHYWYNCRLIIINWSIRRHRPLEPLINMSTWIHAYYVVRNSCLKSTYCMLFISPDAFLFLFWVFLFLRSYWHIFLYSFLFFVLLRPFIGSLSQFYMRSLRYYTRRVSYMRKGKPTPDTSPVVCVS